jgi:hypothetical protein
MEESPVLYISLFEVLTDLDAERSKARICSRELAGIEASNSPGHECLSHVSVVCVRCMFLRRADHSSRGVQPTLVCVCVFVLRT